MITRLVCRSGLTRYAQPLLLAVAVAMAATLASVTLAITLYVLWMPDFALADLLSLTMLLWAPLSLRAAPFVVVYGVCVLFASARRSVGLVALAVAIAALCGAAFGRLAAHGAPHVSRRVAETAGAASFGLTGAAAAVWLRHR